MEDDQVLVEFKSQRKYITIPKNFAELLTNFVEAFDLEKDNQYEFYILGNINNEKKYLNDILDYQFEKIIDQIDDNKNLIIYAVDKNERSEIKEIKEIKKNKEIKDDNLLQSNKKFTAELNNYGKMLKDIINGKNNIKPGNKESNNVINISINNEANYIKSYADGNLEKNKNGKEKEKDIHHDKTLSNKVKMLEKQLDELKSSNEKNNDNINKMINEIEKKYQQKLEEEKKKYKVLKKQYKKLNELKNIIINKRDDADLLKDILVQNDKNIKEISILKTEIDELKKSNEKKQKIIEIYETDIGKVLNLFNKQNNKNGELKEKK